MQPEGKIKVESILTEMTMVDPATRSWDDRIIFLQREECREGKGSLY